MYVQWHWIIINSYNQEIPWTFYFSFNVPLSCIQLQSVHVNHVHQAATVNTNYLPLIGIQFGYTLTKCGRFLVCHYSMTTQLFYEWESQPSFVRCIHATFISPDDILTWEKFLYSTMTYCPLIQLAFTSIYVQQTLSLARNTRSQN